MKKIEYPAKLENLEPMIDFILEELDKNCLDKKIKYQINLACEEALINIINYAYLNSDGKIQIDVGFNDGKKIEIKISDEGIPFDPLKFPNPNLDEPIEMRGSGGLGIYIFKSIIDNVSYIRENQKNVLTFIKKIL